MTAGIRFSVADKHCSLALGEPEDDGGDSSSVSSSVNTVSIQLVEGLTPFGELNEPLLNVEDLELRNFVSRSSILQL